MSMTWQHDEFQRFLGNVVCALQNAGRKIGPPFGLRGLPASLQGNNPSDPLPQLQWERPLVERITKLLAEDDFGGYRLADDSKQRRYPPEANPKREHVDMKLEMEPDSWLWLEISTPYLQDLVVDRKRAPDWSGREFRPVDELTESGLRGVMDNVRSLESLTSDVAPAIALLLIGFDREAESLDDLVNRIVARPLEGRESNRRWRKVHEKFDGICWPDSNPDRARRGFQERCWMWYRSMADHP